MRCSNCHKELMLGSAYCDRCGYSALGEPPPPDVVARPNPVFAPQPAARVRPKLPGRRGTNLPAGCGVTIVIVLLLVVAGVGVAIYAGVSAVVDEVSGDDHIAVAYGALPPNVSTRGSVDGDEVAQFDVRGNGSTVLVSATAIEGFDPVVTVREAGGHELGSDDDGGGSRDSLLVVTLEDGVDYVVEVEGFSDSSGDFMLAVLDQVRRDELPATGTPVGGGLAARQRVQYPLDAVAGREVTIDVHGEGSTDATLRVRDADGQQLGYDDDTNGRDPQLVLTVPAGAVAEVAEFSNRAGEYTITVSCGGEAC